MKTYYFKKLKSGNYEIGTQENHTHETSDLTAFFAQVGRERSTTWSRHTGHYKPAGIIKARYSQSQTYFQDAAELIKHLS